MSDVQKSQGQPGEDLSTGVGWQASCPKKEQGWNKKKKIQQGFARLAGSMAKAGQSMCVHRDKDWTTGKCGDPRRVCRAGRFQDRGRIRCVRRDKERMTKKPMLRRIRWRVREQARGCPNGEKNHKERTTRSLWQRRESKPAKICPQGTDVDDVCHSSRGSDSRHGSVHCTMLY